MNQSISKKFTFSSLLLFALPTMVMMVVMSLYTIVDGVFVSRFVGTNALSSINIVYPIINIVLGIAVMFATGSNAIIARKMGEGHMKEARQIFSMIILISILLGVLIAVLGNVAIRPLVRLLGASDVLVENCVVYLSIQLASAPALILQILFQTYFVTEGKPGIGLFLILLAGIFNVVFDYVFIVIFKFGVAGAALATAMGYMIPAVCGLIYFFISRKVLYFVRPIFSAGVLAESCLNGSSEMVTNLSSGIITFLFNIMMMKFAGEDGVAAITIIQYSQFLLNALFMGFSQGIAPIISFNHGSGNRSQLQQVFKSATIFTVVSSVVIFAFSEIASPYIVGIFAQPGSAVYTLAHGGFILFAISFLFSGINIYSSSLFTALSDGKTSAIISFVRTFCLILVSLLLLPAIIGLTGVWLAIPLAELGAAILSIFYIRRYKTKYGYLA